MKTIIDRLILPTPEFFKQAQAYLSMFALIISCGGEICSQFGYSGLNGIFVSIGGTIFIVGNILTKLTVDWDKVTKIIESKDVQKDVIV